MFFFVKFYLFFNKYVIFIIFNYYCISNTFFLGSIFGLPLFVFFSYLGVILDLERLWEESICRTPVLCLLSMGSDPTNNIENLAKKHKIEFRTISMGQGQEVHARRMIQQVTTIQ